MNGHKTSCSALLRADQVCSKWRDERRQQRAICAAFVLDGRLHRARAGPGHFRGPDLKDQLWGIGQASLPGEVPFRHPQVALTGSWAGAASSGLRQHACGGPQSAASGRSRNFVSTEVLVDLEDELVEHWTLLDDEREQVSGLHGEAQR